MKKSELWLKVDKILWEDWDLIGVNDYGGPDDEYSDYVPSIIKLLLEEANELKISELLHQLANVDMGLSNSLTDHSEIAKKLKRLTT